MIFPCEILQLYYTISPTVEQFAWIINVHVFLIKAEKKPSRPANEEYLVA